MIEIDNKYRKLLLEALEDLMFRTSLQLDEMKGGPLTKQRKALTKKQTELEKLQHLLYNAGTNVNKKLPVKKK